VHALRIPVYELSADETLGEHASYFSDCREFPLTVDQPRRS